MRTGSMQKGNKKSALICHPNVTCIVAQKLKDKSHKNVWSARGISEERAKAMDRNLRMKKQEKNRENN